MLAPPERVQIDTVHNLTFRQYEYSSPGVGAAARTALASDASNMLHRRFADGEYIKAQLEQLPVIEKISTVK